MPQLKVCIEAESELDELFKVNEEVVGVFDFLIEQLSEDGPMLEILFRPANHFKYQPPFEVGRFATAQRIGKNIFRVKVRDEKGHFLSWRMFFGHDSQRDIYYVLSITEREHAYDTDHPAYRELLRRYDSAGIPTYAYR